MPALLMRYKLKKAVNFGVALGMIGSIIIPSSLGLVGTVAEASGSGISYMDTGTSPAPTITYKADGTPVVQSSADTNQEIDPYVATKARNEALQKAKEEAEVAEKAKEDAAKETEEYKKGEDIVKDLQNKKTKERIDQKLKEAEEKRQVNALTNDDGSVRLDISNIDDANLSEQEKADIQEQYQKATDRCIAMLGDSHKDADVKGLCTSKNAKTILAAYYNACIANQNPDFNGCKDLMEEIYENDYEEKHPTYLDPKQNKDGFWSNLWGKIFGDGGTAEQRDLYAAGHAALSDKDILGIEGAGAAIIAFLYGNGVKGAKEEYEKKIGSYGKGEEDLQKTLNQNPPEEKPTGDTSSDSGGESTKGADNNGDEGSGSRGGGSSNESAPASAAKPTKSAAELEAEKKKAEEEAAKEAAKKEEAAQAEINKKAIKAREGSFGKDVKRARTSPVTSERPVARAVNIPKAGTGATPSIKENTYKSSALDNLLGTNNQSREGSLSGSESKLRAKFRKLTAPTAAKSSNIDSSKDAIKDLVKQQRAKAAMTAKASTGKTETTMFRSGLGGDGLGDKKEDKEKKPKVNG